MAPNEPNYPATSLPTNATNLHHGICHVTNASNQESKTQGYKEEKGKKAGREEQKEAHEGGGGGNNDEHTHCCSLEFLLTTGEEDGIHATSRFYLPHSLGIVNGGWCAIHMLPFSNLFAPSNGGKFFPQQCH